ncbi:MAG: NADAR family protein [Bacteroidia bacterium]|nr:NADAR family protein [Bacteroidia bacterium]
MEIEFFWKREHPFSQWHISPFTVDGITFNCAEQYMMYQKAKMFCDDETAEQILQTEKPSVQKQLGRLVKGFDEAEWVYNRERIVYEGSFHKFTQNPKLQSILLETGDKLLAEASPLDNIWGIGMSEDNPEVRNPEKWTGLNLLGKALMKLRQTLREQLSTEE